MPPKSSPFRTAQPQRRLRSHGAVSGDAIEISSTSSLDDEDGGSDNSPTESEKDLYGDQPTPLEHSVPDDDEEFDEFDEYLEEDSETQDSGPDQSPQTPRHVRFSLSEQDRPQRASFEERASLNSPHTPLVKNRFGEWVASSKNSPAVNSNRSLSSPKSRLPSPHLRSPPALKRAKAAGYTGLRKQALQMRLPPGKTSSTAATIGSNDDELLNGPDRVTTPGPLAQHVLDARSPGSPRFPRRSRRSHRLVSTGASPISATPSIDISTSHDLPDYVSPSPPVIPALSPARLQQAQNAHGHAQVMLQAATTSLEECEASRSKLEKDLQIARDERAEFKAENSRLLRSLEDCYQRGEYLGQKFHHAQGQVDSSLSSSSSSSSSSEGEEEGETPPALQRRSSNHKCRQTEILQDELDKVKEELFIHLSHAEDQQSHLSSLQNELSNLRAQNSAQLEQRSLEKLEARQTELVDLLTERDELARMVEQLQEDLRERKATGKRAVRGNEKRMEEYEKTIEHYEEQIIQAEAQRQFSDAEVARLERRLTSPSPPTDLNRTLREQIWALQNALADAQEERSDLQSLYEILEAQISSLQISNKEWETRVMDLEMSLEGAENDIQALRAVNQDFETQCKGFREEERDREVWWRQFEEEIEGKEEDEDDEENLTEKYIEMRRSMRRRRFEEESEQDSEQEIEEEDEDDEEDILDAERFAELRNMRGRRLGWESKEEIEEEEEEDDDDDEEALAERYIEMRRSMRRRRFEEESEEEIEEQDEDEEEEEEEGIQEAERFAELRARRRFEWESEEENEEKSKEEESKEERAGRARGREGRGKGRATTTRRGRTPSTPRKAVASASSSTRQETLTQTNTPPRPGRRAGTRSDPNFKATQIEEVGGGKRKRRVQDSTYRPDKIGGDDAEEKEEEQDKPKKRSRSRAATKGRK